jgi:PKD repeat protein
MLSVAASPTLSVDPPVKTVAVGEAFTVDVTVDYMADMYAFDLTLTFDSAKLNATALDYTGYLGTGGDIFQISVVNNTAGFVNLAVSRLVRSGVTGGGALIVVHFKSLAAGTSVLHLTDTKIAVYPTGAPVAHGTVDGQVNTGGPPQYHQLTVTSSPVTGIPFTIDPISSTTPYSAEFLEGSYTVEMPQTYLEYEWSKWLEDGNTGRTRTFTLNADVTLTAVYMALEANFTFTPSNPGVNQAITFNASESKGTITSYRWDFGDGNTTSSNQPLITHAYDHDGSYPVVLNVTGSQGLWDTTSSTINVLAVPPTNHDIAVTNINPYRTILSNRTMTSINATITNEGDVAETFNVTLTFNNTATTVTLNSHDSTTLTLHCNTTGLPLHNYTFTVSASLVQGETDMSDNSLSCWIQVSILGDINGDGKVDMKDIAKVAAAFQASPNQPRWTANGDLDENGVIDMKDISTTAKHFGDR